ncbi:hypothetical protein [Desulfovibrio sp.]|uniref:hypothetical protein n=1 Tax=Desulfovibrio sp. TaxID=885 RepID=UPI0025C47E00|nr:hypothetical protein [Desulfovibrio sp.]
MKRISMLLAAICIPYLSSCCLLMWPLLPAMSSKNVALKGIAYSQHTALSKYKPDLNTKNFEAYEKCLQGIYKEYMMIHPYSKQNSRQIRNSAGNRLEASSLDIYYALSSEQDHLFTLEKYIDDPNFAGQYTLSDEEKNYMKTGSPYYYQGAVSFIKKESPYPTEYTARILHDWTSMQFELCGQEVYTVEERCAALSAVGITPNWCPHTTDG